MQSAGRTGLFGGVAAKLPDGYYNGDNSNPTLRDFVEEHLRENPYDPATDKYDVPAFNKPIDTTKATAIYNMHTYWSKKPHDAIRQYIRHYTEPGDLVLDPFCGSGGTALAALMEGRKAIAIDRSPAATFITAASVRLFTCSDFSAACRRLAANVSPRIKDRFSAGKRGFVRSVVYTEQFRCSKCFVPVPFILAEAGDKRQFRGRSKAKEQCPKCGTAINTNKDDRTGFVPAELHVSDELLGRRSQRIDVLSDKGVADQFPVAPRNAPSHLRTPLEGNIQPRLWKNLRKAGAVHAADLFSDANLSTLLLIESEIDALPEISDSARHLLHLAVHAILYNCTRMYRHRTHTAGGGGFSGTYYIPHLSKCINPWPAFLDKCREIERAIAETETTKTNLACSSVIVSNESATDLAQIASGSIDYIFTDPPYGGTYHYGALNFLWEAWRSCDLSWRRQEVIVTEDGELTFADWTERLRMSMGECYRVLKPGRWISICFHGETDLWQAVNDIMAEVGFSVAHTDAAIFIDTGQKSYNQLTGATAKKRDLVINYRKPSSEEAAALRSLIPADVDSRTFREMAHQIIRDYLDACPGSTKDRVYDELVSRMIRRGQMQAHNFEEILGEVAEEVRDTSGDGRWYLASAEEGELDAAESAKEDTAAGALSKFISHRVKKSYESGVHYSDLFEHYLYVVKDKPRRLPKEWLLDYFYKTDTGTYRLPDSAEEEQLKKDGRTRGTLRRIKRFVAFLRQSVIVPERDRPNAATLAEWLRHSKRSGLHEYGKLLYEKGGLDMSALSDDLAVGVEEDYQICVRALARAGGGGSEAKPKRGRRKKAEDDV